MSLRSCPLPHHLLRQRQTDAQRSTASPITYLRRPRDTDKTFYPHICQCTVCRKASGALLPYWLNLWTSQHTWTSKSTPTEYKSSEKVSRGFCNKCGGTLSARHTNHEDPIEITPSTIDEKWLVGERENKGNIIEGKGGYEVQLGKPSSGIFWCENDIPGVTDETYANEKRIQHG